jgi:hypothetical protein
MNDLSDQTVMTFAGTAARGSAIPSPTEGMVTYRSDDDVVEVFDGSAFVGVGGGKILQVVSTTKTDTFSTTSSTFADVTGLSLSITPASASNKIFLVASLVAGQNGLNAAYFQFAGGNAGTFVGDSAASRVLAATSFGILDSPGYFRNNMVMNFLDSPATTSAITYKVQTRVGSGGTVFVGRSGDDSDNANHGRYPSSITAIEVAV